MFCQRSYSSLMDIGDNQVTASATFIVSRAILCYSCFDHMTRQQSQWYSLPYTMVKYDIKQQTNYMHTISSHIHYNSSHLTNFSPVYNNIDGYAAGSTAYNRNIIYYTFREWSQ